MFQVLVDVSNPTKKSRDESHAEKLQQILPKSHVIKAFNTISAYTLESDSSGEGKVVYVCGNNVEVCTLSIVSLYQVE